MASKPHTDEVYTQKRVIKNPIKFQIQLNDEQKEAKEKILQNTITVLSGKAGSGKTLLACQEDGIIVLETHLMKEVWLNHLGLGTCLHCRGNCPGMI